MVAFSIALHLGELELVEAGAARLVEQRAAQLVGEVDGEDAREAGRLGCAPVGGERQQRVLPLRDVRGELVAQRALARHVVRDQQPPARLQPLLQARASLHTALTDSNAATKSTQASHTEQTYSQC